MKNPFRKIRWRRLPRRLAKGLLRVVLMLVAILLLSVILLDLYCEVQGLPAWAMDMVQGELMRHGVRCDVREIRAGLLSSVTVEDGTFTATRHGMDIVLRADRVKARLGLRALLTRQPFIKTLDVSGATLSFRGNRREALLPHVVDFSGELRPQVGGAYAISARGLTEGVSVRVTGRIRNAKALWQRRTPPAAEDDRLARALETATRALRQCRFGNRDAAIELTVDADAADWSDVAVAGHWNVSDIVLQGTLAQTFKGQFTASRKQIVFRELMVRLNREEHLFGKVVLEPDTRRVWAEVEGQCAPGTAFGLIKVAEPDWLQRLDFTTPLSFKTTLHPSPWADRGKWHMEVACEASDFALRDMPVKHVEAQIELRDRTIKIPAFAWDVANERTGEQAKGSVTIWPAEKLFSLDLTASLDWRRRCRQLGIPLPAFLRQLDTGSTPPHVRVALAKSPYDWTQWCGSASVRAEKVAVAGMSCNGLRTDVQFGGDTLRVENLRLQLGTPGTVVSGRIDVQLPNENRTQVQLDYDLSACHRDGTAPAQLAAFAGAVVWDPATARVSARGEGTTRLARAYHALGPALGLQRHDRLAEYHCTGKPVRVRFTLPECGTDSDGWRVNAEAKGEGIRYRDLLVKEVESRVSIGKRQLSFTDLRGTTVGGEAFRLNLALSFSPFTLNVSDGELRGNPLLVETFIQGRRPKQDYRHIWQGFTWDKEPPPLFRVPALLYRQEPKGGEWHLEMRGTGEFEEVTLHEVRAKRLTLGVKLDLPGTVSVSDVVFTTDDTVVKGNVQVNTDGVPSCDFQIAAEDGGCDPRVVLRMIRPGLEKNLGTMEFASDSKVTCTGAFFLAKDPRLNLAGTVETKRWHWEDVRLTDVVAKWGLRGSEIRWDIAKATCCKGTVQSTGVYDTVTRIGSLAIEGSGASLNAMMTEFELGEAKPENEAKVALSGRVRFLRDWAGRPLQLAGTGRVVLSEGDLWRVPILSQLGDLLDVPFLRSLSLRSLGKITALRADLAFDGERVAIPNLVTDGTAVSLSGSGEYSWRTERIEFDMVGHTFRKYGFVSWFSKPLSWVFRAQLVGTREDYKWRLNNAVKQAIMGEGSSESRRIEDP